MRLKSQSNPAVGPPGGRPAYRARRRFAAAEPAHFDVPRFQAHKMASHRTRNTTQKIGGENKCVFENDYRINRPTGVIPGNLLPYCGEPRRQRGLGENNLYFRTQSGSSEIARTFRVSLSATNS